MMAITAIITMMDTIMADITILIIMGVKGITIIMMKSTMEAGKSTTAVVFKVDTAAVAAIITEEIL
jgi:hypothetical protein